MMILIFGILVQPIYAISGENQTKIVTEYESYDFGEIHYEDEPKTCRIPFLNIHERKLTVKPKNISSGGIQIIHYDEEVLPGEQGVILFKIYPYMSTIGINQQSISFEISDSNNIDILEIPLSYSVIQREILFSPETLSFKISQSKLAQNHVTEMGNVWIKDSWKEKLKIISQILILLAWHLSF